MSVLVIGAGNGTDIPKGADVLVLPTEHIPIGIDATFHKVDTVQQCLKYLRYKYASHDQISHMGALRVQSDHVIAASSIRDEWMPAIDHHLEMIVDDIGNCPMDSWNGARHAIQQGAYLETCPNTDSLHNTLAGKPAVCLGAGPTAQALLPLINPETHYVFCCDAMLRGISFVPQFTCMLERVAGNFDMLADVAGNGSRLIALPVVDPRAAQAFNGKCLWWMTHDLLCTWLAPHLGAAYAGRSSGSLSVAAALLAGCNPIYLVGHDLAYQDGQTHAEASHQLSHNGHRSPTETENEIYHMRRCTAEATAGGTVESCGLFTAFRQDIEMMLDSYPDRTVINCGGLSKIRGTVMGELGTSPFVVHEPTYVINPIRNRMQDIKHIIRNMGWIQARCTWAQWKLKGTPELDGTVPDTTTIANKLLMSNVVDQDVVQLFNYVFRAITNNLNLRAEFRVACGADPVEVHRSVLRSQATTMHALCETMIAQLEKL